MPSVNRLIRSISTCVLSLLVSSVLGGTATNASQGSQIDKRALHLLVASEETMTRATSLSADYESRVYAHDGKIADRSTMSITLKRPNLMRVETHRHILQGKLAGKIISTTEVSDGTFHWIAYGQSSYFRVPALPDGKNLILGFPDPQSAFFSPADLITLTSKSTTQFGVRALRCVGKRRWNGELYDVIEWSYDLAYSLPEDAMLIRSRHYVGKDNLIHHVEYTVTKENGPGDTSYRVEISLRNLKINMAIDPETFRYSPSPKAVLETSVPDMVQEKMLRVGLPLPDLTIHMLSKGEVSVRDLVKGKRALLLYFWNYGCYGCRIEYRPIQEIYDRLKQDGLEVVVIDVDPHEPLDRLRRLIDLSHITVPNAVDVEGESSLRSQLGIFNSAVYICDDSLIVRYRGLFDEGAIKSTLTSLGLK
jgi:peroxiredoxin/outer membrane lipoprotein-sorting protein